jgi:hypothetical protein
MICAHFICGLMNILKTVTSSKRNALSPKNQKSQGSPEKCQEI